MTPEERMAHDCWINRYGKVIHYKPTERDKNDDGEIDVDWIVSFHTAIARQCFPNVYHGNAEKTCEDLGWIKVVCPLSKVPISSKYPTQSQINALYDMGYNYMSANGKKVVIR